ncbi:MAG: polyprenyl synthetase family protein [Candidatus Hermodarchaeota archaeon]
MSGLFEPELAQQLQKSLVEALNPLPNSIKIRIEDYILGQKGKMVRPLLVMKINEVLAGNEQTGLDYGIAVELLHNMSLIHDDILDHAPLRRGRPAYHARHGIERAVNDGDVLLILALYRVDERARIAILQTALEVAEGQAMELDDRLDNRFVFTADDALKIMKLKTATVFRTCIRIACEGAGREDVSRKFRDFSIHAGIAFQIQDDLLDILGESEVFGKKSLWDIQESKRNLFLAYALEKQNEETKRLIEIYSKPVGAKTEEEVQFVANLFRRDDGINRAIQERERQLQLALDSLENVRKEMEDDVNVERLCEFLREFAIYMVRRDK